MIHAPYACYACLVPIELVKVGEKVLSWDERTGETSVQPVMELIQHEGTYELVKVTLENGEQLEATAGHPFYVQGKGWNAAANLKVGDALLLYNGTTVVVKTVDFRVGRERIYNFSVAQNANYFVGLGGVGVHNSGGCPGLKGDPYHPDEVTKRQKELWQKLYGEFDPKTVAEDLGYNQRISPQKAPFNSHGQPVFFDGKRYISPDVDSHNVTNGWKMFDNKGRRIGTWSSDLSRRIKD